MVKRVDHFFFHADYILIIIIKAQKGHTVGPKLYECDATVEFQFNNLTTMR